MASYSVLVLYAVSDPLRHGTLLRILLGVLFLSGVARATSVLLTGWPVPPFIAAMGFELLVMPLMLLWLRRVERPGKRTVHPQAS